MSRGTGMRLMHGKREAVCAGAEERPHQPCGLTQPWGEAVLTLKMKKSSMNMAPKGRIPAMRMLQHKGRVNAARRPRPQRRQLWWF